MPEQPCDHVDAEMIAAGFSRCAACKKGPTPPAGFFEDDTSHQEAAVQQRRVDLAARLSELSTEAHKAGRACGTKRGKPDIDAVTTAFRRVQRAEEALDQANYDLSTAKGAHG